MNELLNKYAQVILNTCLKVESNQPLFISANYESIEFVRIIASEAYKIGVKDIYFDLTDTYLKHDMMLSLTTEELKSQLNFNKEKWNEYAKKGAAFVMLASEMPGIMHDIDPKKLSEILMYSQSTRTEFDSHRDKALVPWCIAAAPTKLWAQEVFGNVPNALDLLWNKIFEILKLNEKDPVSIWNENINTLSKRSEKLNNYNFKTLRYKNSLGTDFKVSLPKDHLWASGKSKLATGKEVLVNFPTYEVFTSPAYDTAEGIVYASKPLSYQETIIKDFYIKFKDGVAYEWFAKEGNDTLTELINSCENSNRLGEVALVENDSPISNANIIFYETLYDENAACHLALGASFPECIKNGEAKTKEELNNLKLNQCQNHVDFMIGTKDLEITGITYDNQEIPIFVDGNFTKIFK